MAKSNVMERTAFADLVSLKCWPVAEARLREGASPAAVAAYIQGMGEATEIKQDSLKRQLQRYKGKVLKVRQTLSATYVDEAIKHLSLDINDVDELTKVILMQKERVSKDLKLEKQMPKLAPWLTREIQLLFDMIERRAKLLQTLGVHPTAPQKHQHTVAVFGDGTWSKILDQLGETERTDVRELIQMTYGAQRDQNLLEEQQRRGMVGALGSGDDDA